MVKLVREMELRPLVQLLLTTGRQSRGETVQSRGETVRDCMSTRSSASIFQPDE